MTQWPAWALDLAAPSLNLTLPNTIEDTISLIDGMKSLVASDIRNAEGVVWHTENCQGLDVLDGRHCFKTISNKYLLKHQD
jgi:hypothetical protein